MKTEAGEGETQCVFSSCRSRDLLLRFSGRYSPDEAAETNGSDSDEIELGLSLGGCFNSANSHKNRILRSASIPVILPCDIPPLFTLFRTCSLPVDEMQSKMEPKRKREESRNFRTVGERVDEELEEGPVLKLRRFEIENEGSWIRSGDPAIGVSSPAASRWIAGAGLPPKLMKGVAPALQGSVVSDGSNSSGGSEMENRSGQDPMKTEAGEGETQCMFSSCRSRDLLLRFSGSYSPDEAAETNGSDSDEIELGLSLGGCFNSANTHKNRILRSASIPVILPCDIPPLFTLFRTCSLPVDEMQSKMEPKRKREESRNFSRVGERVDEELEEGPVLKLRRFEIENEGSWIRSGDPANGASSPAASRWIAGAGLPSTLMKGVAPALQGSVVSDGSNSSGGSEMESRSGQGFELSGFSHTSEIRSPLRLLTNSEQNNHKSPSFAPISKAINGTAISNGLASNETLARQSNGGRCSYGSGEIGRSMQKHMPLVSTKVDGPNSRRIEGFLYEYGNGDEVRIVCVCHGSFFTPAEFVKHAGGGEVAHPLRHIVVNPSTDAFFS